MLHSNLPSLQFVPVYPAAHLHEYPLTALVHVPPLAHGVLAQLFTSTTKNNLQITKCFNVEGAMLFYTL
jgi:hypothetical protein